MVEKTQSLAIHQGQNLLWDGSLAKARIYGIWIGNKGLGSGDRNQKVCIGDT